MDKKIKQYADAGDLTTLRYVFVDSLDVDPTFEQYEEAYNYCKSIPGFMEQHIELTPFINDASQWTETYWGKLKMDLEKNFSDQRMSHMRKVAKVFLADKVQRILKERQAASKPAAAPAQSVPRASAQTASSIRKVQSTLPTEAEQEKALQEEKRRLEMEYKRAEEQEAKQRATVAAAREAARAEALKKENQRFENPQKIESGAFPKKAVGIAIAVAAVAVVLFFLLK